MTHTAQVVAYQIGDRVVFGRLLVVAEDGLSSIGQGRIYRPLHREATNLIPHDAHKGLRRKANESSRQVALITSLRTKEDLL